MADAKIKELKRSRGVIKGKLTIFSTYFSLIKKQNLSKIDVAELELRLERFSALYDQFDILQVELELISDDEELVSEREQFESSFYRLQAEGRELISQYKVSDKPHIDHFETASDAGSESKSDHGFGLSSGFVRLPKINIPVFSGSNHNWLEFRDTYVSLIHSNPKLDNINKFHYLRNSLQGSALLALNGTDFKADNYNTAWESLLDRYDNKRILVNNHIQALFNVNHIEQESSASIRNLIDTTKKNLNDLKTLGQPVQYWDTIVIYMMSCKLDSITHREWEKHRNSLSEPPTLDIFTQFLCNKADLMESLEENHRQLNLQPTINKTQSLKNYKTLVVTDNPKKKSLTCFQCKKDHYLFTCPEFRALPVQERIKQAKNSRECMNCLRPGHTATSCPLSHCKYCKYKHNTLLHIEQQNHEVNEHVALTASLNVQLRQVLLSTALVKILDSKGEPRTARLLLDNGSTTNFITEDLCSKLNLKTININSRISGINNQSSESLKACSITILSIHSNFKTTIDSFVLPKITSAIPSIRIHTTIDIPKHINLADPSYFTPASIDILVGADTFWAVLGSEKIQLGKNKPTLYETKLGWLISGMVTQESNSNALELLCMHINEDVDLTRFWELDTIQPKYEFTKDERECESTFIATTTRDIDGRFIVRYPLKESSDVLGDSLALAKVRFLSLERKFCRNLTFKNLYHDFMHEYQSCGHMSERNQLGLNTQTLNFLPHHGVLRESSTTTKLRAVFDASAKTSSGKSLNNIQLVGPTVQDDLLSILLRFRKHRFVVTGDIQQFYRQILIDPEQRHLQNILWRSNQKEPIKIFTLNTVTYGTASAPYLATRCLAELSKLTTDGVVSQSIAHDFYVDDYLSGSNTIQGTISLINNVIAVLKTAKLNLRKFQSNSQEVLLGITEEQPNSDSVDLCANQTCKTLGLNWNCKSDYLSFRIDISLNHEVTKRHILSIVAQVFDPLGLVGPCIVEAKLIIQLLWKQKCSWDEIVPANIRSLWDNFVQTLPCLNDIHIPRGAFCVDASDISLHIFTDASEKAYGACAFVRSIDKDGSIHVHLLSSKGKVGPIKPTTTPRLELFGALLGTRLCVKILDSLNLNPFPKVFFWCDSTIVLGWLSSSPTHLKPFIRRRVCEIQDKFPNTPWKYVPTNLNPADLVSRGLDAHLLSQSSLWWTGPPFLQMNEKSWPVSPNITKIDLPESIQCLHIHSASETNLIINLLNKFSNLNKIVRIVSLVLKFIYKTRKISHDNFIIEKKSINLCIRISQTECFLDDINLVKLAKPLPKKSKILNLNPFLDPDDLLRVGGRLVNSNYEYNLKHPVILSAKCRLAHLIFESYHRELLHAGMQLLLNHVRQKYWVLGGRNLARKTVRSCVKCVRFKGAIIQPMMGNLPKERVELEFPFLDTGVDYAGPVMIADRKGRGCRLVKSYICLFVCLATKALHLELVSELTKEAFIAALDRLVARRGKPRNIFSDNGTTFVGAFNELAEILKLEPDLTGSSIKIHYIPAYTPHFGGLWESAVKSTKHHLRRILGLTHLTYEEMSTCLIQIEGILNSRPLTPLSDDPSDLCPLTPAHLLIGRSLQTVPHLPVSTSNINQLKRYERIQALKQHFWNRFSDEYVTTMQKRTKWQTSNGDIKLGSLVLIKDKLSPPLMWLLGRVVNLLPGPDGISRVAEIKTRKGIVKRAFNLIVPLPLNFEDESSTGAACSQHYDD